MKSKKLHRSSERVETENQVMLPQMMLISESSSRYLIEVPIQNFKYEEKYSNFRNNIESPNMF